jgi:multiple sugar transport system substrate-binding protein
MRKKIICLLTASMVVSTMLLSGCGSKTASTPSKPSEPNKTSEPAKTPEPAKNEPVQIRVAWWGDAKRNDLYNQILAAFQAENPNIKTVPEPVSWTDYWDKMTVQSASGGAPDFMGMHPQFASDYIRRGVIQPLDSYIKDKTIDLSNWPKSAVDTGVVDGVDYMVPMGLTTASMFVNSTLLESLGVKVPGFDWTWDDVKTTGLAVRKALDAKGQKDAWFTNDASGAFQMFRYWARQNGKDLYTSDGQVAFNEEDLVSWFNMWNDLRANRIVPDAATTTTYAKAVLQDNLFAKKLVAATSVPINQYTQYTAAVPGATLVTLRNPVKTGAKVGEYIEGAHFAISSKTTNEKKLAAAKLINFWVNKESAQKLFKLDQGVPGNSKMAEFITPLLDPKDKVVIDYVGKTAQIATPTTFAPAGATQVDSLFQTTAEEVRYGQKTPQKAAADLVAQAKDIVKSAKK